jgi:hypothetical protein
LPKTSESTEASEDVELKQLRLLKLTMELGVAARPACSVR